MAISWETIKALLLFFGPWLVPRAIGFVRGLKQAADQQKRQAASNGGNGNGNGDSPAKKTERPTGWQTSFVLALLGTAALVSLCSTLSLSSLAWLPAPAAQWLAVPENVFVATDSRLQTPTDVLFTRLATVRPAGQLTAADETLRARLVSLDSRLLYLQYGPDVLAGCVFCGGGTGVDAASELGGGGHKSYLYYAAVGLAAQYLAVLVLLTLATSPFVLLGRRAGPEYAHQVAVARVRRWRTPATVIVLLLLAADVGRLASYDRRSNTRAPRLADLDMFFWTARRWRGAALALLLALLGNILHAAARGAGTGTMVGLLLFGPLPGPTAVQRVAALATPAGLGRIKGKLNVAAIVRNTIVRDRGELRARSQAYWAHEVQLIAETMEEREVLEGVHDALQNRIDMQKIEREAEAFSQSIMMQPPKEAAA